MTKKQPRRKLIKSIIENVDPEVVEKIRGTKTEIDGKLKKILGFIEEGDDNGDKKESVGGLIEDILNHYEFLCTRYDHLTEELKEEFHGSSSSSLDSSDSDDSPEKNGEFENIIIGENVVVEQELVESTAVDEKEKEWVTLECVSGLMSKNVEFSQLEEENQRLQIRNSEIEKVLIEKEDEMFTLKKKYEKEENVSSGRIAALTAYANSLQDQLQILGVHKNEADGIIEKQKGEISALENKIVEHERKNIELDVQLKNTEEGLKSSVKEVEQLQDQIRKVVDSKNQDINELEETIADLNRDILKLEDSVDDLNTDLEIKEDEINTLMENMRTTEVKQRLTSQKLRITEQVFADKEDGHQKTVESLLEEKRVLQDMITSLSEYIEALTKMESEVCEKVNETLVGIDTFGVKFEEDFGHLESRIYEITNELKVIMNWVTGNETEQDQLKQEIARLVEQLKEEKDKGFQMTIKIEALQALLQDGEDERTGLIQTVREGEEKMGELEKIIRGRDEQIEQLERKMIEKDDNVLSSNEGKRAAIKQLCIWIDDYQTRYNDIKDMFLKARGGRMRIGA